MATLEEMEAEREKRKAESARKRNEQKRADMAKLAEFELEHGDDVISYVEVERYAEGFPALVIVRMPKPTEFKRYQQRVLRAKGDHEQVAAAIVEVGDVCTLYPEREVLLQLDEARPGIREAAGGAVIQMTGAKTKQEGKS